MLYNSCYDGLNFPWFEGGKSGQLDCIDPFCHPTSFFVCVCVTQPPVFFHSFSTHAPQVITIGVLTKIYWIHTLCQALGCSLWSPIPTLQEGGPLPGPKTGLLSNWPLLSNTRKWIVRGDTCADKARDFIGKGCLGKEQKGKGTQENCSATWLQSPVLWWWD